MLNKYKYQTSKYITYILGSIFIYSSLAPIYSNKSHFYHYQVGIMNSAIIFPISMLLILILSYKYFNYISYFFRYISDRLTISHILILSLFIRILWIIFVDNSMAHPDSLDLRAKALFDNNKYFALSIAKPMGTPILTAWQYYIFGYNRFSGLILQVLASIGEIYLVYIILNKIVTKKAALIASLFLAIHPESIFFTNLILSDSYFSVLVLLTFFLLFFFNKYWIYIITGIIAGIAYYIRPLIPIPLVVIFSFIIYQAFKNRGTIQSIWKILLFIVMFVTVMIPQIQYNYKTNDSFSLATSNQLGISMAFATSPYFFARCNNKDTEVINKMIRRNNEKVNMITINKYGKQLAIDRIKQNPLKYLFKSILIKPYILWGNPGATQASVEGIKIPLLNKIFMGLSLIFNRLVLILASLSLLKIKIIMKNNFILLLIAYAILVTISQLFLECQPRYSHMFIPLQCILIGLIVQYKEIKEHKYIRNNN